MTDNVLGERCNCAQTASKPYRYTLPGGGEGDNSVTGVVALEGGMTPASSPNRGSASTNRLSMDVAGRITLIGLLELDIMSTICIGKGLNQIDQQHLLNDLPRE
jgi:hypothetical protein